MIINNYGKEVEVVGNDKEFKEMIMVVCIGEYEWNGVWEKNGDNWEK